MAVIGFRVLFTVASLMGGLLAMGPLAVAMALEAVIY